MTTLLTELRTDDLRRVVTLSSRLSAAETFQQVVTTTVGELRVLVDGDFAVHNVVDPASGRALMACDPPEAVEGNPGAAEYLAAFGHQHPQIQHWNATDDPGPTTISDFVDTASFHGLDLYEGVFGPVGVEDVLTGPVTTRRDGVLVALSVMRSRRSFTPRDRGVMEAVLPIVRAAIARTRQRAALDAMAASPHDCALVVLGEEGRMIALSPRARRPVERWLGTACTPGSGLPEAARRAVRAVVDGDPSSTLMGDVLPVVGIRHDPADGVLVLELEVEPQSAAAGDLAALGVTPRQAEILVLIARGASNRQIATTLGISPHTVRTQNERIFATLGVNNRTSAAAIALSWRQQPSSGAWKSQ